MDGNPLECACVDNINKWAKEHNKNVDIFYSEANCIADRIRKKIDDLDRRLKEIKGSQYESHESTTRRGADDSGEVELLA